MLCDSCNSSFSVMRQTIHHVMSNLGVMRETVSHATCNCNMFFEYDERHSRSYTPIYIERGPFS